MQVLKDLSVDKLINLYVGLIVTDKKHIEEWDGKTNPKTLDMFKRKLAQDEMILGALKCAKANGFTGE